MSAVAETQWSFTEDQLLDFADWMKWAAEDTAKHSSRWPGKKVAVIQFANGDFYICPEDYLRDEDWEFYTEPYHRIMSISNTGNVEKVEFEGGGRGPIWIKWSEVRFENERVIIDRFLGSHLDRKSVNVDKKRKGGVVVPPPVQQTPSTTVKTTTSTQPKQQAPKKPDPNGILAALGFIEAKPIAQAMGEAVWFSGKDFDELREIFATNLWKHKLPKKLHAHPFEKSGEVLLELPKIQDKVTSPDTPVTIAAELHRCCSDDSLRPAMRGVYFDAKGKCVVACDGFKLIKTSCKGIDMTAIIDPASKTVIDEVYPDYNSVIPKTVQKQHSSVLVAELLAKARAAVRANKFIKGEAIIVCITTNDKPVYLNPEVIEPLFTTLYRIGIKTVDIYSSGSPLRPVLFEAKGVTALCMPVRATEMQTPGYVTLK